MCKFVIQGSNFTEFPSSFLNKSFIPRCCQSAHEGQINPHFWCENPDFDGIPTPKMAANIAQSPLNPMFFRHYEVSRILDEAEIKIRIVSLLIF
jgi:hypothetical protein